MLWKIALHNELLNLLTPGTHAVAQPMTDFQFWHNKEGVDYIEQKLQAFIATEIAKSKQEGANIAIAVKLSSQDQLKTYIAALAQDLLPIQNEKKHNEAVEKLLNIKN